VDTPKQFYASDGDGGSFEVLEAQHGTGSGFDPAMILFDQVVQVLRGSQFCAPGKQAVLSHLTDCSMRRRISVEGDRVRRATFMPDGLIEECFCCGYVSCPAEPEVNSVSNLVHCPIAAVRNSKAYW